ncbi:TetR/AcrR family transcriptional regulator [Paenibacillus sp. YIM B09110]|uniref:TetR/AcrR family transcriptional regulator n=1 Tax=Paenibacillus sp. YIM B09110 TaxID=3126102 RepID=UPI00301C3FC2
MPTSVSQQRLKQSLLSLIASNGYRSTTIIDITKHAELSRTAFYNSYHSKEELLQDLIDDMQDGFLHAVKVSFDKSNRVDFSAYPSMLPVFHFVEENAAFFDYLFSPNANPKALIDFYTFLSSSYTSDIRFTPETSNRIDATDSAQYLALASLSFIGYWVNSRYRLSASEMDEQLQRLHREKGAEWYFTLSATASDKQGRRSGNSNPEDRRIARTRSAIKEGLLGLLRDGIAIESITVKEITDRANIRRATFYGHYRNKTHLVEQMIDDFGGQLIGRLFCGSSSEPLQNAIQACDRAFDQIFENSVFLRILNNPRFSLLFTTRMLRLLRKHYRASSAPISFDRELYVHYVSGVMLELVLTKAGVIEKPPTERLTAEKLVRLINQKEYRFTIL